MTRVTAFLAVLLVTALPASADLRLPELTGRVVDLANVLSPETEDSLTEQLAAHAPVRYSQAGECPKAAR